MRETRLSGETAEYTRRREELRQAEIELMRHRERVAEMRRSLPPGATVADYRFLEGPPDLEAGDAPLREVRLSELFSGPDRPLVVYHFMYGKRQQTPCPMCTLWIDGFNGIAQHLAQNVDLAIVAAAEPATLRQHARDRGWRNLRLLGSGDSSFKYDLGSEDEDDNQESTVSVFSQDADGTVRHVYSAHPAMSDDIRERGIDLLSPLWHVLDLTPQGRGDWYAELDYSRRKVVPVPEGARGGG